MRDGYAMRIATEILNPKPLSIISGHFRQQKTIPLTILLLETSSMGFGGTTLGEGSYLLKKSQARRDGAAFVDCPEPPRSRLCHDSCPSNSAAARPKKTLSQTITLAHKKAGDAWKSQRRRAQERSSRKLRNGQGQSAFPERNGEAPEE
jgi:hypothetical protein